MRLLPLILALFCFVELSAQVSPYHIRASKDVPVLGTASGMLVGSFVMRKRKPLLDPASLETLDINRIPKFDHSAAKNWSPKAAKASDLLLYGSALMPLGLIANKATRDDFGTAAFIGLETAIVNFAITALVKESVKRKRPFVYNPEAPQSLKLKADATSSFFSGHTSVTASMSFLAAKMYNDYNPGNTGGRAAMWSMATALPLTVAYLRWRAGKHYLSDVIGGFLAGMLSGILVPAIHNRRLTIN